MTEPLFGGYDPPPAPHKNIDLSAGRRLTLRQAADILAGRHPLTRGPLHPEADRNATKDDAPKQPFTCGTCIHRQLRLHNDRHYPKCTADGDTYVRRSATTDVRAWWPACTWYCPDPETWARIKGNPE